MPKDSFGIVVKLGKVLISCKILLKGDTIFSLNKERNADKKSLSTTSVQLLIIIPIFTHV